MTRLDALQVSTLLALLDAERPLSARRLGERLGVSARTLRYRLPLLQAWLNHYGIELIVKPRQGLLLNAPAEIRQRLRTKLQQEHSLPVLRSEERVVYLLFLLLAARQNLTFEALRLRLSVSRATLLRDLREVESRLNEKGVLLRRSRQQGPRVLGPEVIQRHLLIEILLHAGLDAALTDLSMHGKVGETTYPALQQVLLEEVKPWNLYSVRRFIMRVERELGLTLTDDDLLFLTLYWALALQRMHSGRVVSPLERVVETFLSTQEMHQLEALVKVFAATYGVSVPRDEVVQLLIEIKACQGQLTLATPVKVTSGTDLSLVVAEQMLKKVGEHLGYDLCQPDILSQMAVHLTRALARLQAGLPLYNPLTQEVRQAYAHLWQPSLEVVQQVRSQFGLSIPEEEVAYLVMYLALAVQLAEQTQKPRFRVVVACPTGGVMARLLVYRLQNALPEIEIVATVSLRQLSRLDALHVDLVISTVKIPAGRWPVITVNPLLGEEDIQRIKNHLENNHSRRISTAQKEREVCR
ncbi:transcription antiterminator [uncultured Thermanaerothrix sp.]|uniref:BglG family transcription antiterminator n=1 Tax=uncultured Thermanaerothrix sp. TaxID=1195149 RepID=UPI00260E02A5|nr:transcription antiterminator [uncultured Thermanaerothrix sp.]